MKKTLISFGILVSVFLAGCASDTTAETSTSNSTEPAAATGTPAANPKWEEAGVHVAEDGVVRNKDGKAYCTVMNEVVVDEATATKAEKDGVTYKFCCAMCPDKFAKDSTPYQVTKK